LKGDLTVNSAVNFTTATAVNAQFSGASPQSVTYQSGKTVKLNKLAFTDDDPSHVTVYNGASYVNVASIYTTYGTLYSLDEILTEVVKAEIEWELVDNAVALQPVVSGFGKGHNSTVNAAGFWPKYVFHTPTVSVENSYTQIDVGVYARAMGAEVLECEGSYYIDYGDTIHVFLSRIKYDIYEINALFNWSKPWIPNGQEYAVYIGTQRVHGTFLLHSNIIVFTVSGNDLCDDVNFKNALDENENNDVYEGVLFTTLGAGPSEPMRGTLISAPGRPEDEKIDSKPQMVNVGVYDIAAIKSLFALEVIYRSKNISDKAEYCAAAIKGLEGYNSNSFTHGLLLAADITPIKPDGVIWGWSKVLPQTYFVE
jgi:hypothetical protein